MSEIPDQDRPKLYPPPTMMTFQFGTPWHFVTPAVYRYEDQQWIDEFFDTGKLRLSTFAKFATYGDEGRGDALEGKGVGFGLTSDNMSVFIAHGQGVSAAVFCCSHQLDRGLMTDFERNAAFQITNTFGFAYEISRQLAGFRHGFEGSCIYRSDATIRRAIDLEIDKYKRPDGTMDIQMAKDISNKLGGAELLLIKRKQYETQKEYRLLWELDTMNGDHVDVVAPLARQFCRKVDAEEWES